MATLYERVWTGRWVRALSEDQRGLVTKLVRDFMRDLAIAWAVRGGVGFLPHILKLLRLKRFEILDAIRMAFGESAARFGIFVAVYFLIFKVTERLIERWRGHQSSWNAFLAGAIASISLVSERESTRWILAQYLAVRAIGSATSNALVKYPRLAKCTSKWGDAAIFGICAGQAVYSFVVRPDTVDPTYKAFLTQVTHMPLETIELFQNRFKTGKVDPSRLALLLSRICPRDPSRIDRYLDGKLTCELIHPDQPCWLRVPWIFYANFRVVFPMYFSLHLIPTLLFHPGAIRKLEHLLGSSLKNGAQSSAFLSTYVAIFQTLLCIQRNLMDKNIIRNEWRYIFWLMGFISAASVFIEKKSRRSELALYMLPRAGVSLYRALVEKGLAFNLKFGEFALMAASMAVLLKTYRKDTHLLSPIMARIFNQFLS